MRNKGVAYRRMLASFATVFVIPLFLVFVFYFYSYVVIEKQVEAANENFVQTIQSTCDRELQYYQNVLTQLSMNEQIEDISEQNSMRPEDQKASMDLMTKIYEVRASIGLIGNEYMDIFVYFPEIDRIFSCTGRGSMRFDTYAKEHYSDNEIEREKLKAYLSTYSKTGLLSISIDEFAGEMALVTHCSMRVGENSRATLGLLLDMNALINRIASMEWSHGYDWLIIDDKGVVVKGTLNQYYAGETILLDNLSKDDKYMVYTSRSGVSDWTYVLLMPRELVQESATQIRTFFAISIILCVLLACILIRNATKLNYAPLENLLKVFQPQNNLPINHKNEYQFLRDQIKDLVSAKSDMESDISRSKKSLVQWGLTNMLIKPYERQAGTKNKDWESYAQSFSDGQNLVLMVKERPDGDRNKPQGLTDDMKMFIIENVFLERIGEILHCSMVELEGRQVLILHSEDIGAKMDQVQEGIFKLQRFILENFDFSVAVSAGAVHLGLEGIHKSYLEARETEEFIPVLDQDFISYEEIKDKTFRRYDYSLQAEERISAAIQNNNVQLAIALVHKVIDNNWSDDRISPNMLKFLLHDIFCTLLKTADQKGCIDRIHMLPKELSISEPVSEIKAHFSKVVESICDSNEIGSEISSEKALCTKVLEYVRQNYSDPSLNISQTAFHFHMSPTSLSATYKNETGKSLLMVINEIRIENAIEFLKQGCSVVETAVKVGIPESSSFIRLFKKHMGITPGQMKSNMREKKQAEATDL